jgi:CRP/FNR family cyclic AMP-dependent transcriptional regulator
MADTDVLASIPLFSKLSKKDLARLHKAAHEITYDAGTVLASEDEIGRFFFIILDGEAKVDVQGREIRRLGRGDYFGEMALIDRSVRAATVTAESPLRCLTITQIEFRPLATEHPDVAWALLEAMVERVRESDRRNPAGPPD